MYVYFILRSSTLTLATHCSAELIHPSVSFLSQFRQTRTRSPNIGNTMACVLDKGRLAEHTPNASCDFPATYPTTQIRPVSITYSTFPNGVCAGAPIITSFGA